MNDNCRYLLNMARRCAVPYLEHPEARAAMLSGSAAEGVSDNYSDIDLMIYYESLPSQDELNLSRRRNGGAERNWLVGSAEEGSLMESYPVDGVECQIVHSTICAWEREMAEVLEQHAVDSPLQKALAGTLHGIPLMGETWIAMWKAQAAAYPDGLRDKMVSHNLSFFPVWGMGDRFFGRDANLWFHQVRVETIYHVLGILAGLNRVYFTTFQFKRTESFVRELKIAPAGLYERIETILASEPRESARMLESLVRETVGLIQREMYHIDLASVRARIDHRSIPWTIPS